jgi:hypothetical protein
MSVVATPMRKSAAWLDSAATQPNTKTARKIFRLANLPGHVREGIHRVIVFII